MHLKIKGPYKPVFYPSIIIITLLSSLGVLWPHMIKKIFDNLQSTIIQHIGWLYMLGVAIFLCFCLFLMLSRLGDIKLGPEHSVPEYSNLSWFSMLFAAGMGIGLMFFCIAEPLQHFLLPPEDTITNQHQLIINAMNTTFFHWGLHAWSIYGIFGLSLAYFTFRHQLPLLPRSLLYPLIGKKIFGWIGHTVDILAIIGTIFGIATSLGLGSIQVNAGMNYLYNIPIGSLQQTAIITVITIIATISVSIGLDKGIRRLSNLNIVIALFLLLFIIVVGNTSSILKDYVQNIGDYLNIIIKKTFNLYSYQDKEKWLSSWTLFYWGWWIAWAPFVGMFIAKISKGRTIREFLIGVIFIPSLFVFLWMTVFGNSAISQVINNQNIALVEAAKNNIPVALFAFLNHYPFSSIISVIAIFLVITFFITSADSGSMIIDMIATGNAKYSLKSHRIAWSCLSGLLAISLLLSNGLTALQTASIISALPILIILLAGCVSLLKSLRIDYLRQSTILTHNTAVQYARGSTSWKDRLDTLVSHQTYDQCYQFIKFTVIPALEEVAYSLQLKEIPIELIKNKTSVVLKIKSQQKKNKDLFIYHIQIVGFESFLPIYWDNKNHNNLENEKYYRAEVFLEHGGQKYDVMGYTKEQVIADIITQYERHLHYLRLKYQKN